MTAVVLGMWSGESSERFGIFRIFEGSNDILDSLSPSLVYR